MSAILGVVYRDGRSVAHPDLMRMAKPLAIWGPDATGFWSHGPAGLGHRSLETTVESEGESLPFEGAGNGVVITADARIDNRRELLSSLGIQRPRSESIGDGELILTAYQKWGRACPGKLQGDFAFAVWDSRKGEIFCARDPMGVRPFYYHLSDRLFVFATQIEALLCLEGVPARLDELTLADYLALLPPDKVRTFYRDIVKLPPGHSLSVSPTSANLQCYWSLDVSRELRLGSDREYADAFREKFTEALSCRLRSSVRLAAMLSGGLDSSAIVGAGRQLLPEGEPLMALSAVFPTVRSDAPRVDEAPYIRAVSAGGRTETHHVRADDISPLLEFLWSGEEPVPAASMYMDWKIFHAARDRRIGVLLSGNDGDSVVSHGRGYLAELAWNGKWVTLLDELYALSRRLRVSPLLLLRRYVLGVLVPAPVALAWRRLRRNGGPIYDRRSVIRPEFARRTGVPDRIRALLRHEKTTAPTARAAHVESLESTLLPLLLESFARGCAAFSLEPRYPFLDRRLIEFCVALPGDQKLSYGWDRVVMRRAMSGVIPAEIQWRRRKQNLSANFNLRLLDDRELLDAVVLDEPGVIEDYVDVAALRGAYRRYLSNPRRASRDSFSVFWTVVFALWLQERGPSP